jgi:hypothetical protein
MADDIPRISGPNGAERQKAPIVIAIRQGPAGLFFQIAPGVGDKDAIAILNQMLEELRTRVVVAVLKEDRRIATVPPGATVPKVG